jgi:cytosine/adenosine deaminase-related metal-dependent hydrolase
MHLAETREELELLRSGTGEFKRLLSGLGLWNEQLFCKPRRPMEYLRLLSKAPRSLVIHGNYLETDELEFIAANPQMTLVYCPRTHAAFGHAAHPWRRLMELGGRVALGTDSRASNPDLSMFGELQFLAQNHPDVSDVDLLRLGSIDGRRALGFAESIEADFTLIELSDSNASGSRPQLFAETNRVVGTMIRGDWCWTEDSYRDAIQSG